MIRLDRPGIFKAKPVAWSVWTSDTSKAVALNIEFKILAQLNAARGWDSWEEYEEHNVYGSFFVVKKDETINEKTVEQLVASLGWDMDLRLGPVPDRVVQITVKAEEYQGKTQHKVSWMNPEDYTPGPMGTSDEDVGRLQARFGSLLRAAGAGAAKANGKKPAPSKPPPPANPISGAPMDDVPLAGDPPAFDRERVISGLLEEKIRSRVKQVATLQGLAIAKQGDLDALSDEQLSRLHDAVFDANLPF